MTAQEYLLSLSTLPKTGTYTLREHFNSIVTVFTALSGGDDIEVSTTPTSLSINPVGTNITIEVKENTFDIADNTQYTVVDNVKEVNIVIDPSS